MPGVPAAPWLGKGHSRCSTIAIPIYIAPIAGTRSFSGSHDATSIQDKLLEVRLDFGLFPKVTSVDRRSETEMRRDVALAFIEEPMPDRPALTTDCGSNMICAAQKSAAFDWHPCVCHLLNTAVVTALAEAPLEALIEPVRTFSAHIRRSSLNWGELRRLQVVNLRRAGGALYASGDESEGDGDSLSDADVGYLSDAIARVDGVPQPKRVLRVSGFCKTRWNSTFFLLKRMLLLEQSVRAFVNAKQKSKDKDKEYYNIPKESWPTMRKLVDILEPIKEVSERLEGDHYITISDALYYLLKLIYDKMDILDPIDMADDVKCHFVRVCRQKLCHDLDDPNIIYCWAIAAVMDGRRSHLTWLRRIWDNKEDWPTVTGEYATLHQFRNMLHKEIGDLVSIGMHGTTIGLVLGTLCFLCVYLECF